MKNLIFAIIVSVFYACNFSTEPETTTQPEQPQIIGKKKITTILISNNYNDKFVIYSGAAPDTVFPAYIQPQPNYKKVDSIWGFYKSTTNNDWQVKINDGMLGHWNVYASNLGHKFIKKWEK